jgi:hypothetical protein
MIKRYLSASPAEVEEVISKYCVNWVKAFPLWDRCETADDFLATTAVVAEDDARILRIKSARLPRESKSQ